jgi:ABC-2 type transport system permease protein
MSTLLRGFTAQLRALAVRRVNWLMLALCVGAAALSVATYRQGAMREMPAAVYDQDGTGLSRTLVRSLDATPELRVVTDPPATLDEAQAALVRGDLAAVVLIPDGFTADVKRGRRAELVVAVDMSNILVGKTAQRATQRVLATLGAGVQLSVMEKLGVPRSSALARVVAITATEALPGNPGASYAAYASPAFGLSFAHILVLFLAWTVLWPPAPDRNGLETVGRLAACFVTGMFVALALTYGVLPLAGLSPASGFGVVTAALAALVAADLLFATAVCAVFRGGLIGFQATVLLGMLSLMLSGLTWPWDTIPPPLRAVSSAIPFTPFGRALRLFLPAPVGLAELAGPFGWMGLQCLGFLAVIGLAAGAERLLALALARRGEVRS